MAKSSGSGGNGGGAGLRQDYKRYVKTGKAQGSWWKPMPFSRYVALARREKAMREAMDLNRG